MQKKSKNFKFLKKFFFARNNLKCLKICSQHHLCSPRQISGRYLSKKKLVIFQEICDPGYAKKVKKFLIFGKIFFSLETTLNALKFFRNTICAVHEKFQAGISQKRSWSLSRNLWPRICKKSKKIAKFQKKIFMLETTLNALKFVCNTISAVHDKFQTSISQKSS